MVAAFVYLKFEGGASTMHHLRTFGGMPGSMCWPLQCTGNPWGAGGGGKL